MVQFYNHTHYIITIASSNLNIIFISKHGDLHTCKDYCRLPWLLIIFRLLGALVIFVHEKIRIMKLRNYPLTDLHM